MKSVQGQSEDHHDKDFIKYNFIRNLLSRKYIQHIIQFFWDFKNVQFEKTFIIKNYVKKHNNDKIKDTLEQLNFICSKHNRIEMHLSIQKTLIFTYFSTSFSSINFLHLFR